MNYIDSLYGTLLIPEWTSDLIIHALEMHGEWGATEAELAASVIPTNAKLWDLGAFVGTFSLGVAQHTRLNSVIALEINPDLSIPLRYNLEKNLNVPSTVVSSGVGPEAGWLTALGSSIDNHGAQSFKFHIDETAEAIPCVSLPGLRALHGNYDAIKLDIEGMERAVLIGDSNYLREYKPVIWAECNEDRNSLELFSALKWLGYKISYVGFPAFREGNFMKENDLIYPLAYEAALLATADELLSDFSERFSRQEIIYRCIDSQFDLRRALYDTPRWGEKSWESLNRAELIARLGRVVQGSRLCDFLLPFKKSP